MNPERLGSRQPRILLTKPTQDCHDRGVRYLSRCFRDAGFEVIFTNFLLVEEIVSTAAQEDVDVIGVSSSSGGHMPVLEDLIPALASAGASDVLVMVGGIIPASDAARLTTIGVGGVFGPGATATSIVQFVKERLNVRVKETV